MKHSEHLINLLSPCYSNELYLISYTWMQSKFHEYKVSLKFHGRTFMDLVFLKYLRYRLHHFIWRVGVLWFTSVHPSVRLFVCRTVCLFKTFSQKLLISNIESDGRNFWENSHFFYIQQKEPNWPKNVVLMGLKNLLIVFCLHWTKMIVLLANQFSA